MTIDTIFRFTDDEFTVAELENEADPSCEAIVFASGSRFEGLSRTDLASALRRYLFARYAIRVSGTDAYDALLQVLRTNLAA